MLDDDFLSVVYKHLQASTDIEEVKRISMELIDQVIELTNTRISVIKNVFNKD